ncbi:hypothetical protein [Bradyrhizobium sp. AUGA SZCCT0431]|uniref:hypothetical protein n=1 Tax=Bradyrhizobium sp. AUGA SZCCT0431 TaxID=2807674 RepID=UPI001BA9DD02|nr:hypothetical protein [Bradyrhizobium sp. AUGA SZCCT0431]MBR1145129.1 hypothetical protein [Bradyrhizobium sp. AUGA SZCCT0431]
MTGKASRPPSEAMVAEEGDKALGADGDDVTVSARPEFAIKDWIMLRSDRGRGIAGDSLSDTKRPAFVPFVQAAQGVPGVSNRPQVRFHARRRIWAAGIAEKTREIFVRFGPSDIIPIAFQGR